jgi:quercetin dioxygenase-like cupin family protein
MKITRVQPTQRDDRGEIIDILVRENIEYVTLITSRKGASRGHHYHKRTTQWVYILEGRLNLLTQIPGDSVLATVLEKGDLALTEALERHGMIALEDSAFMVFTHGVRGGEDYEKDTFRLAEPLHA